MIRTTIQTAPFDAGAEIGRLLGDGAAGGIGCFIGTVRGDSPSGALAALELEHYPGMTEQALETIAQDAARRWPLLGCTIIHRVGRLLPGEGIVLVLAAAAHRKAALDATAFLIDWLKTRAPFWKKEVFASGTQSWVAARAEDEAATDAWSAASSTGRIGRPRDK